MGKELRVIAEWEFTPADLFEEDFDLAIPGYEIHAVKGTFSVTVTEQLSRSDETIRDDVERKLQSLLSGVQLQEHKPASLSLKNFSRATDDGRRGVTIFVETALLTISGMSVDFVMKDKDGNIIADTKADRVRKKQTNAKRVLLHGGDPTLQAITASFQDSLKDPTNAMVYLFEIRDALKNKFGSERDALKTLSVGQQWKLIGQLANDEGIREGRHRGIFRAAGLREATTDELKQAREAASGIIGAYLDHLDCISCAE